jgi:hypothetical protein
MNKAMCHVSKSLIISLKFHALFSLVTLMTLSRAWSETAVTDIDDKICGTSCP